MNYMILVDADGLKACYLCDSTAHVLRYADLQAAALAAKDALSHDAVYAYGRAMLFVVAKHAVRWLAVVEEPEAV